jgi:hypothetical protein
MEQGPVVVDLLKEGGLRRDVDGIVRRTIERLRAADADGGAGGRGERLGLRTISRSGNIGASVKQCAGRLSH